MLVWAIISTIGLLAISFEDITGRSVHFFWFIISFIGTLGFTLSYQEISILYTSVLPNLSICLFVTLMTLGYYFLKYKKDSFRTLKRSIGMGDLLILPTVIVIFSPMNFILFCVCSITITLIGHSIYKLSKNKEVTIPLAGIWSLGIFISIILTIFNTIDTQNDNWIYLWLMN